MNRTQIIGDFADRIGVEDSEFEEWRDAHVSQTFVAFHGLHVLVDTRWNQFAVYVQASDGSCSLAFKNFAGCVPKKA